jgi:hypothetical protein
VTLIGDGADNLKYSITVSSPKSSYLQQPWEFILLKDGWMGRIGNSILLMSLPRVRI